MPKDACDIRLRRRATVGFGVFDAAKDGSFHAFGVDVNQCPGAPGLVVDNVIKEVDVVTADSISKHSTTMNGARNA